MPGPVPSLVIHFTQHGCILLTRPPDNSTCLPPNRHPGFCTAEDRNLIFSGSARNWKIPERRCARTERAHAARRHFMMNSG